jgi:hypothetical protein
MLLSEFTMTATLTAIMVGQQSQNPSAAETSMQPPAHRPSFVRAPIWRRARACPRTPHAAGPDQVRAAAAVIAFPALWPGTTWQQQVNGKSNENYQNLTIGEY